MSMKYILYSINVQSNIHNHSRTFYKIKIDGQFGLWCLMPLSTIQMNLVISKFMGPLQNFELSEIRLKGVRDSVRQTTLSGKFDKSGCKLLLLLIYNILIIFYTYCVRLFNTCISIDFFKIRKFSDEVLLSEFYQFKIQYTIMYLKITKL